MPVCFTSVLRRCSVAALVGLLAAPAVAQDAGAGAQLFQQHCVTCHGLTARGDGPLANALIVRPTDLTALAAGNGGVFPTTRVAMRIDGRDPLVSHGSPMPVFGAFLEGDDTPIKVETGQPMMTSRAVADLIAFLEEVQG